MAPVFLRTLVGVLPSFCAVLWKLVQETCMWPLSPPPHTHTSFCFLPQ